MKLTPLDIRKQEFKRTMRGFDSEEVEAFLSMVADELELILREKNQLNDEVIKLRTQLKDYQQVEHTLRDTLVKAQNTVDESRVNSRKEAELIIHEAELQSENILKEAREELLTLRHEISLVRTQRNSFIARLRHLLESQVELLEVLQIEDIRPDDFSNTASDRRTSLRKAERNQNQIDEIHTHDKQSGPMYPRSPIEPKIIRGDKRYNEPSGSNPPISNNPGKASGGQRTGTIQDKNETGEKLSDQFIF
jgi:cell division initiation protein